MIVSSSDQALLLKADFICLGLFSLICWHKNAIPSAQSSAFQQSISISTLCFTSALRLLSISGLVQPTFDQDHFQNRIDFSSSIFQIAQPKSLSLTLGQPNAHEKYRIFSSLIFLCAMPISWSSRSPFASCSISRFTWQEFSFWLRLRCAASDSKGQNCIRQMPLPGSSLNSNKFISDCLAK